jgi:hypothetical protein
MIVEVLRNLRTCKDGRDGRCSEDTVHDDTVAERCRVGQDDGDDVQESDVTNLDVPLSVWAGDIRACACRMPTDPVDRIRRSVRFDVVARRLHDRSHDDKEQHAEEAFDTAPDVENFGDEQIADTTCDRSDDTDDCCQSMCIEGGGDIRVQVGLNR